MSYPLSDQYMYYNFATHRYILTPKDVRDEMGVDLQAELRTDDVHQLQAFLRQISNMVYNYLHKFQKHTELQDFVIAKTEGGRNIIKRAMEQQALYVAMNGDLSRSLDRNERELAIDEQCKAILDELCPPLSVPLTYAGTLPVIIKGDESEW